MALNDTTDSTSLIQAALTLPTESRTFLYSFILVVLSAIVFANASRHKTSLPILNYDKSSWSTKESKARFQKDAKKVIAEGFRKFSGPFNVITGSGPQIVLPPDQIEAVNAEPSLSFLKFNDDEHLAYLGTFSSFHSPRGPAMNLFDEAVMKGLTRSLPKFTKPLSDQMSTCLSETWAESSDWHTVHPRGDVLQWVARLSTRIFHGEELTKNQEWLQMNIDYVIDSFKAMGDLKYNFPKFMYPLAEKFLPICRKVRSQTAFFRRILGPMIAERHREIRDAAREGRKPNLPDDAIDWFRDAAHGHPVNEVNMQIGLSMAAIHTTSDLLTQALFNLAAHPEFVEPLRQEAVDVLRKHGWKKVALTELRLLDSFFKETQRIKPVGMVSMSRTATRDVELPTGIKIYRGERMTISSHRMWSADDYENPETFDGYRFLNRRKIPGLENKSSLVTTSVDHTAFSHGKHACPGRFFAANEVKIAMVHVLLKYDIKAEKEENLKWMEFGVSMMANPMAMLQVRRRKEEIYLDDLVVD